MAEKEDKIKVLEEELSTTKYNKATQGHFAVVKAKIAKIRDEIETRQRGAAKGTGYGVRKSGDASVALLGFPSVGKSTLLNALTSAKSKTAAYEFTTLDAIPGVMLYKGAKIQIIDIPGIVKGAASGTGRGREVLGVVRASDLILFIIDASNAKQLDVLLKEVYDAGIRINSYKPQAIIKSKARGGISLGTTVKQTHMDKDTIEAILGEFRIMNGDVVIREDITPERFIDAVQGNRVYTAGIISFNKIDVIGKDALEKLKKEYPDALFISAEKKINLDLLKSEIFERLKLMRIFLKQPERKADLNEPLITKKGATVKDVCEKIHKDFVKRFRYAKLWGKSAKFPGQKFTINHVLQEGDIVELVLK
ncbi:MAG: GTP-binding protein [Nanoarchaeota archaeon]